MRYFLLGLPGSGKSHWGKIWSESTKLPYFDLDEVIENNEGQSIADIFKNEGEEYFRNLETFYLNKLIDNYKPLMLSTGGGTPCFNENLELMNAKGTTIFLNPPIEEIAERISKPVGGNKRPMFSDCHSIEDVQKLLYELKNKRLSYYQKANFELEKWEVDTILKLQ
ncbi:shikimate kinase [Marivirga sp.]|uniref:shikimate kinase n=1 Tax=Marivirga sp. TaxID=2018662 RepID=UPI0025DE9623|nr:shikimate kinase [Marivirga sp.]